MAAEIVSMRVLGIDPGSGTTGYGVIDTDGRTHHLAEYGAIRPRPGMSFAEKLLYIEQHLHRLIERVRPDAVALEEAFSAVNVKTALKLGQVRGVALLVAARAGLPIYEYSPLEVKSATTGYGRAEKHQVQQMVKILLRLPAVPHPHDAADALAIAICHIHHHPNRLTETK
jgi:crossover junction endodeoxyribonuclease RuvC